eukprot:TRINITY_DN23007_c0_g1_i1.p1 TRINITY_DN23007_c0_g1~~TRINITY_DN23007_c0_g1_i1.p1  ORF type:complete len:238 (+),score=32.66 TRINITY_DN23007_c0_g1_i1:80-793(+)
MGALPWKMMVCPLLLLVLNMLKFRYDHPPNRLILRILYGISQSALFLVCGLIAYRIKKEGDSRKTVKLKASTASGEDVEETLSYQDYDLSQLRKMATGFLTGAGITTLIHVYMGAVPPLLFQTVMQPMSLFEHPLFAIYVLRKIEDSDEKLKRPFPEKSAKAQFEAMMQNAREERRARQEIDQPEPLTSQDHDHDVQAEDDQDEVHQTVGTSAPTGDSQVFLSTTERRHPSLQSVEQ